MAKTSSKAAPKAEKKKAPSRKTAIHPGQQIEKACVKALAKLQELELDYQLQSEINWCLGSFRNDGNPIGLYMMAQRALTIFKAELALKTKGVTATFVKELEKALKTR
ncbi:MAG: hypothetical protein SH819_02720 [Cytophagales bacterium]|nr:hypothetical protein [Cytophagales bacterium]